MTKKPSHLWKPGQSGNPKGKPAGSGELQKLRAAISEHVPEIIAKLVTAAQAGDVAAARLLLERVLPPVKAVEQAQAIDLPADASLTDKGHALLQAAADGELAPSQAAGLITALGSLARIAEVDELERRISALEEKRAPIKPEQTNAQS